MARRIAACWRSRSHGRASDVHGPLLFGGSGNDTIPGCGDFFYVAEGFGTDTITHFKDDSDRFNLAAISSLDDFGQHIFTRTAPTC
ncbi:MAG: hypothetical protein R3D27_08225 [Hyphomicrobiaceae bacterium]